MLFVERRNGLWIERPSSIELLYIRGQLFPPPTCPLIRRSGESFLSNLPPNKKIGFPGRSPGWEIKNAWRSTGAT